MRELFDTIEAAISPLGGWTTVPKAHIYAAAVIALKPAVCVEIGVWCGRGSLAVALALKQTGRGSLYAIDAWSAKASVAGQLAADAAHWERADYDGAYRCFVEQVQRLGVQQHVNIIRSRSDAFEPPDEIGFLIVDGNHGDEAIGDVRRYAPKVRVGGLCYMDDLDWATGSVRRAESELVGLGFTQLYVIDGGAMYQRIKG